MQTQVFDTQPKTAGEYQIITLVADAAGAAQMKEAGLLEKFFSAVAKRPGPLLDVLDREGVTMSAYRDGVTAAASKHTVVISGTAEAVEQMFVKSKILGDVFEKTLHGFISETSEIVEKMFDEQHSLGDVFVGTSQSVRQPDRSVSSLHIGGPIKGFKGVGLHSEHFVVKGNRR